MPTSFVVNSHSAKQVPFFSDNKDEKSPALKSDIVVIGRSPPSAFSTTPLENGFVNTVCEAYNHHYDLVLRPDNVWLAILIQFASYVQCNAEDLRKVFVNHDGKQELTVVAAGTLHNAPYDQMALSMVEQISANLKDASIKEWALPNFSTTTLTDQVVGAISLMATMKEYFSYKFCLECGLTKVTMDGTVEDWEVIERKVQRLLEFDNKSNHMQKWVSLLAPVCSIYIVC